MRIDSADGLPGVVLAELYDATPAAEFTRTSRRMLDIAVLKGVGGGVTADFVISGDASKSALVRAVDPALGQAPFNVRGVSADPQLALFNGTTQIGASADWGNCRVRAQRLPPPETPHLCRRELFRYRLARAMRH